MILVPTPAEAVSESIACMGDCDDDNGLYDTRQYLHLWYHTAPKKTTCARVSKAICLKAGFFAYLPQSVMRVEYLTQRGTQTRSRQFFVTDRVAYNTRYPSRKFLPTHDRIPLPANYFHHKKYETSRTLRSPGSYYSRDGSEGRDKIMKVSTYILVSTV